MKRKLILISIAGLLALWLSQPAAAQDAQVPYIRLAEFDVDPAQLDAFAAASNEHIEAALRLEPGVVALYAVAEKGRPGRMRVFELYVDADAYRTHLQTSHFKKFLSETVRMIQGRKVVDAVPVRLGVKAELPPAPLVRVAELQIAPDRLDAYKAAVTEEIDASIRVEPGVLAIYAVALRDDPSQLRFFEIYADERAYRQHIDSLHFKKYVDTTKDMITARQLFETNPIALRRKPH